jgi:hypothetical protein
MTSLTALLIGMPDSLPKAYPEALRAEIGKKVRLLSDSVCGAEWKNRTAVLAEADVLFPLGECQNSMRNSLTLLRD